MANENQLIISVSAETIELVKALATAQNGLQDFAKEGKTTSATLTSALSAINKESKNTFDATALAAYNKSAQEIKATLKDIRSIGIQRPDTKAIDETQRLADVQAKLETQAKKSRVALYGLNQVVRDLPFGFIAISNNIPVAIDQFQSLIKSSGGVGNAFKNLGNALIGAGGLSLAFSAITSLVTSAIQKYGSLGTALNDVLNLIDRTTLANIKLTDSIDAANASSVTEVDKVRQLVSVLSNAQEPLQKRNNAYRVLAKEYPGIIQNITDENALTKDGITQIRKRSEELVNYILLKGQEAALTKLVTDTSVEGFKQQRQLIRSITGEGKTLIDDIITIGESWFYGISPIVRQAEEVGKLNKEANIYSKQLNSIRDSLLKTDFDITGQGGAKQLTEQQRAAKKLKEDTQKQAEEAAKAKINEKVKTLELNRQKVLLEQSLRYLAPESKEYAKIVDRIQIINGELKKIGETEVRILAQIDIDTKINREKAKKDLRDLIIKTGGVDVLQRELGPVELNLPIQITTDTEKGISGKYTVAEQIKQINAKIASTPLTVPLQITRKEKEFKKLADDYERANKKINAEQKNQLREIGDLLGNVLNSGIKTFQQGIAEGVDNTKALKSALKDVGKELTKIIIKLAAIEVIKLIASAISGNPQTGQAVGSVLSRTLGVPDLRLGGQRAANTRGIDIGPGGLAIGGRVVFVQRGPDLVGVLQQANGRINRVG
jgi:hypothetical protein